MKHYLILFFTLLNLNVFAQELELIHLVSSDQTYSIKTDEGQRLVVYLSFYFPAAINYKETPHFFVSGWYQTNDNIQKKNLTGIYRPFENLVLFVSKDTSQQYIDYNEDFSLTIDTAEYIETFYFPLNTISSDMKKAVWFNGSKNIAVDNIDFDKKNVYHKVFIKGGDISRYVNRSIDITDFVIKPFGDNNIFLEDYNISIHSSYTDDLENLHILLQITNEYVNPSSLSSGGYYYLMLDKNQIIRKNKYFETYNQGQYISSVDDGFIHPSKKRILILADWSDSQIIGSFFIEKSRIEIEKEWNKTN